MESRGRERVGAGHHEAARRVARPLDNLDNLAVLVGAEDAVSGGLLVGLSSTRNVASAQSSL